MIDQESKERMRNMLSEFITTRGMRRTPERFTILDKVLDQHTHFDVDTLYQEIDAEYHVSRSTVYNSIELFCDCGIVRKQFLNGNRTVYELAQQRHLHLICLECGAVKEVSDGKVAEYVSGLKFRGFRPTFSSTNIYGICSRCSKKKKRKRINNN